MHFFPSRNITLYMAKLFVVRSFAVLAMLVLILMTLDLLGESGKILSVPGNDQGDVLRYISMRAPQIIARFLPFSVLLGTLIAFATLSQNSEVIAMKAAGLSAHQILAPMFVASLAVAGLSFTFNDLVVAPNTARLKVWQAEDYGPVPVDTGVKTNVWVREGQDLIQAGTVTGSGEATRLGNVSLYLRSNGSLRQVIKAREARYSGQAWELVDVSSFDVATTEETKFPKLTVGQNITPDRFNYIKVDGDSLGFFPLMGAIQDLKAAGRRTDNLEGILWHKLSGPLSTLLMPLLGAVAAFGLARSGALFLRAVIGMALGFAYFVADNFALAMGNLGAYPPWIAAWGPFLLFLLIGETVLVRTEE
ncbi:MAG: LPS export ABC transporter permease LptG [Sphingopyxis sp.]|jgi:lipopolysaccharide export system permease protein|nr:LPS export ABC transporter permease LptG [Sphingopyxis sp.]